MFESEVMDWNLEVSTLHRAFEISLLHFVWFLLRTSKINALVGNDAHLGIFVACIHTFRNLKKSSRPPNLPKVLVAINGHCANENISAHSFPTCFNTAHISSSPKWLSHVSLVPLLLQFLRWVYSQCSNSPKSQGVCCFYFESSNLNSFLPWGLRYKFRQIAMDFLEVFHNHQLSKMFVKDKNLAILCALFGMVAWPLERLSDLRIGDKKVTLNHLDHVIWKCFSMHFCHMWLELIETFFWLRFVFPMRTGTARNSHHHHHHHRHHLLLLLIHHHHHIQEETRRQGAFTSHLFRPTKNGSYLAGLSYPVKRRIISDSRWKKWNR